MNESTRDTKIEMNIGELENINPMSHQQATQMNAVEMYVLSELTPEEELRFEAHYFGCEECARAVAVEEALSEVAPPKTQPWWRRLAFPVLIPAEAALLVVVSFQNVHSIPTMRQQLAQLSEPQANTVIMAREVEKGIEQGESIKTPSVSVEFLLPEGAAWPFYRVDIQGAKLPISQVIPAPEGMRVSLHVLSERLGHGRFNVVVHGLAKADVKDGPQVGQYQFNTN
jgi:hypothetical protein